MSMVSVVSILPQVVSSSYAIFKVFKIYDMISASLVYCSW